MWVVMVLDFLFIFTKLVLDFVNDLIHASEHIIARVTGDKIVLMFSGNLKINFRNTRLFQIDGYFDCGKAIEHSIEFIHFRYDQIPRRLTYITMSRRYIDLHNSTPVEL